MIDRRQFLQTAVLAGAGAAALPPGVRLAGERAHAQTLPLGVVFDRAPFTLGVASGDPEAESVILWTRLAPEPLAGGGDLAAQVEVDWVVAQDPRLRRVVTSGTAVATVGNGHSVHVDARGLQPGRTYFYRFAALGRTSRIGRTRTAPAAPTERLRLAHVSCQDFQNGAYAAYGHLAREDVDLVVHLGDYLYEYAGDPEAYRQHTGAEVDSLESYRDRHALYRGDPQLRAAHAAFPWVCTWDDHEFDNNYADLNREDSDGPGEAHPELFAQRRANAYQAYYEHLPIRLTAAGPPDGPDFRIYRRLVLGDLLDLSVLDTRQYRSDQPCVLPGQDQGMEQFILSAPCGEEAAPDRTILGAEQRDWLKGNLDSSTAAWRGIAQQVMVGQLRSVGLPGVAGVPSLPVSGVFFNFDQWDGYQADRTDLLAHVAAREIPDVFVITGDIHSHWVHDLALDFGDPGAPIVATEYVGTSITSAGFEIAGGEGAQQEAIRRGFYLANPHLRYFQGTSKGYAILEVTRDAITNTFRVIADVTDPHSPVSTLAAFRQERGSPTAEQILGEGGSPRA